MAQEQMPGPQQQDDMIGVDIDGTTKFFPRSMPLADIQAQARRIREQTKQLGPDPSIQGMYKGALHATPSIVGGAASFVHPALGGPAAGLTRAVTDAIEGKNFDPAGVGLETGLNAVPAVAGNVLSKGVGQLTEMMANAAERSHNFVGGILGPVMRALGVSPETVAGARVGGGTFSAGERMVGGTPAEARSLGTKLVQRSVDLENAAGRATPTTQALDVIAQAIQRGQPVNIRAVKALQDAGFSVAQINDMIASRIRLGGHAALSAVESQR